MRAIAAVLLLVGACSGPDNDGEWKPAFEAEDVGWLLSVWGPSSDNRYSVGGEPDRGVMMNFNGDAWSPVDLGFSVPLLNWVFGFGPNDITAVGNDGTIAHWDGSSWTLQATPTTEVLWGVWGASPSDLWAVGGAARDGAKATLLHYDGSAWTEVEPPVLQRPNVFAFFKVWGTSASNVYVVGQRGVVLHYDGSVWTEELVGASQDLIAVWGTGPDNIVAVGGRANGIVSIFDGTDWRTESLAPTPGLNGIWLDSTTNNANIAHVVGSIGTFGTLDLTTFEVTRKLVATDREVHAVFSADGETITAVGGNLFAVAAPYNGIAFERQLGENE